MALILAGAPRPKILTEITVPTGGWALKFKISVAASLDTTLTATVPAGTYFISWDAQSDDLLWALADEMTDAIDAGPGGLRSVYAQLNSDNKVQIIFNEAAFADAAGDNDVSILWSDAGTSDDLAAALGFDSTTDDTDLGTDFPIFTADWQHSHGWYADDDGQLESLLVEDHQVTDTPQAIAYGGQVKSTQMGSRFVNEIKLAWLGRALTFSRGVGYGTAPVHPYARNVPLECWWREAQQGKRFRIYREGRNSTNAAIEVGVEDASNASWVEDSSKSFDTDPQEHAGMCLHVLAPRYDSLNGNAAMAARFHIASHTAVRFTAANATPDDLFWSQGTAYDGYRIIPSRYETYVMDLAKMREFAPSEKPELDLYDITVPLLRYES